MAFQIHRVELDIAIDDEGIEGADIDPQKWDWQALVGDPNDVVLGGKSFFLYDDDNEDTAVVVENYIKWRNR